MFANVATICYAFSKAVAKVRYFFDMTKYFILNNVNLFGGN